MAAADDEQRPQQDQAIGDERLVAAHEVTHKLTEQTKGQPQDGQEGSAREGEQQPLGQPLPAGDIGWTRGSKQPKDLSNTGL